MREVAQRVLDVGHRDVAVVDHVVGVHTAITSGLGQFDHGRRRVVDRDEVEVGGGRAGQADRILGRGQERLVERGTCCRIVSMARVTTWSG